MDGALAGMVPAFNEAATLGRVLRRVLLQPCVQQDEVPISYYARSRGQGKKLTWLDGIRALGTLLRLRLSSTHPLFGVADPYHSRRLSELGLNPQLPELPGERAA